MPKRILITGAGGFVGSWLTRRLARDREPIEEVLALGQGGGHAPSLDIVDAEAVDRLVAMFRPTCVVHLAALSSPAEAQAEPRRAWDVNLHGTLNLAEAVLRHAPSARFVFASSSEIYGGSFNAAGGTLDESGLPDPRNVYAAAKAAADLALGQMSANGLEAVRLRLFNHTGPGQTTRFVVPAFAAQIAEAEKAKRPTVVKVGNLKTRRDFLDVRDVVEAYVAAIRAAALPPGVIMNIASGMPRRVGDVLDDLISMSGCRIVVEEDPARTRPSDISTAAGNADRASDLLGWRPAIPWRTTLRDILEDFRASA